MGRLILLDNERRTYPPASAHRMRHTIHNPNLVALAVWSTIALGSVVFAYWVVRVAMLLWNVVSVRWS